MLAHARALLTSTSEGATAYLAADARDTGTILEAAAETLDFSQPVAVMVLCVLQYVPDSDVPQQIVSRLMAAVPPGSYLALSDGARDIDSDRGAEATERCNARLGQNRLTPRTRGTDRELLRRPGSPGPRPGTAGATARPGEPGEPGAGLRGGWPQALMRHEEFVF